MSVISLILCAAALGGVELRGGALVDEPIDAISIEGVHLAGESARVIGWDRVKRVDGEWADDAREFMDIADSAWRARTRLARGDYAMAEPLFEKLFEIYRDGAGPTTLVVAEGLMRCRIVRGARGLAVEPWLVALRVRNVGQRLVGEPPIPPLIDESTGLVPPLAPFFEDDPNADVVRSLSPTDLSKGDDPMVEALARLYAQCAGGPAAPERARESGAGAMLVASIIDATATNEATRTHARGGLREALDTSEIEAWMEAWIRVALGLSLLMEADDRMHDEGLLQLAHLPARFGRDFTGLTSVALATMAEEMLARGRNEQAQMLLEDLRAIDPNNPALRRVSVGVE